ncbi:MAG: type II toxin-antitoxin system VapC family toxin [Pseudomonadota bacterium]
MIVLDTNVISEPMKRDPSPVVMDWLNAQAATTLFITAINQAEVLYGIAATQSSAAKDRLNKAYDAISGLFVGRILPFDSNAARRFAIIAGNAKLAGSPLPQADGYIAAIAATHGFAVATRDQGPFAIAGIEVIDPWERDS